MSSILCLYKWKNYSSEVEDNGKWWDELPSYNSRQSRIHSATEIGEIEYVVTYHKGHCYLVGRIVISGKDFNTADYRYGIFRIEGDPIQSQFYECRPPTGLDVSDILRKLEFKTGKRIGKSERPLALHLQVVRELTEDDVVKIDSVIPR